jgi:hypothetical protein
MSAPIFVERKYLFHHVTRAVTDECFCGLYCCCDIIHTFGYLMLTALPLTHTAILYLHCHRATSPNYSLDRTGVGNLFMLEGRINLAVIK